MGIVVSFGRERIEIDVGADKLVALQRSAVAPPLSSPAATLRLALEQPTRFPALRRALTPDDHVTIVIDDTLPRHPQLLEPILEHLEQGGVTRESVKLLFASAATAERWRELPAGVKHEVHDAADRNHLSYLATSKGGRRIYLNRSVVDADQAVVLCRRGYDPLLGYSGAAGALYPAFSDEATIAELSGRLSLDVPGADRWPLHKEAAEVAWLLGAPFFVQAVEGLGDEIAHVVTGVVDSGEDGERLLDARWRASVPHSVDTVLAAVSGDPAQLDFGALARALACAARIVKPQGRIVLLAPATTPLGAAAEIVRSADNPEAALAALIEHPPHDAAAVFQWASAAQQASLFLLSGWDEDVTEELFATPLTNAGQAQRLIAAAESCAILQDAHKMLVVMD